MTNIKPFSILGISGSLRKESYNTALLHAAIDLMPPGMTLEIFDLSPLPIFNQDFEKPFPEAVVVFRTKLAQADALLIATPEYNSSITGALKNALDWASCSPLPLGKPEVLVARAGQAFDADGKLVDAAARGFLQNLLVALAIWSRQVSRI